MHILQSDKQDKSYLHARHFRRLTTVIVVHHQGREGCTNGGSQGPFLQIHGWAASMQIESDINDSFKISGPDAK